MEENFHPSGRFAVLIWHSSTRLPEYPNNEEYRLLHQFQAFLYRSGNTSLVPSLNRRVLPRGLIPASFEVNDETSVNTHVLFERREIPLVHPICTVSMRLGYQHINNVHRFGTGFLTGLVRGVILDVSGGGNLHGVPVRSDRTGNGQPPPANAFDSHPNLESISVISDHVKKLGD